MIRLPGETAGRSEMRLGEAEFFIFHEHSFKAFDSSVSLLPNKTKLPFIKVIDGTLIQMIATLIRQTRSPQSPYRIDLAQQSPPSPSTVFIIIMM